jgi:hypothetical protein
LHVTLLKRSIRKEKLRHLVHTESDGLRRLSMSA